MIDATTRRILADHAKGDSYRTLERRYGLPRESCRQLVLRETVNYLTQVEMDLHLAAKLERMGRDAMWPTFVVPYQSQDGWQAAQALFSWTVERLRANDLDVRISSRPTPQGVAFQLTLGEAQ